MVDPITQERYFISLQVRVPVLSVKIFSICPNSSFIVKVFYLKVFPVYYHYYLELHI